MFAFAQTDREIRQDQGEASSGTDVQTLGAQHVLILSYKVHVWFSMLCLHQEGGRYSRSQFVLFGKRMSPHLQAATGAYR